MSFKPGGSCRGWRVMVWQSLTQGRNITFGPQRASPSQSSPPLAQPQEQDYPSRFELASFGAGVLNPQLTVNCRVNSLTQRGLIQLPRLNIDSGLQLSQADKAVSHVKWCQIIQRGQFHAAELQSHRWGFIVVCGGSQLQQETCWWEFPRCSWWDVLKSW